MFDMPDYIRVGRVIVRQTYSYHFDDEPAYDMGLKDDFALKMYSYELSLPELGPFILAHLAELALLTLTFICTNRRRQSIPPHGRPIKVHSS
jgi:hypothetical protein